MVKQRNPFGITLRIYLGMKTLVTIGGLVNVIGNVVFKNLTNIRPVAVFNFVAHLSEFPLGEKGKEFQVILMMFDCRNRPHSSKGPTTRKYSTKK